MSMFRFLLTIRQIITGKGEIKWNTERKSVEHTLKILREKNKIE